MGAEGFGADLAKAIFGRDFSQPRQDGGILYVEDFDAPPAPAAQDSHPLAEPPPGFTGADIDAAYEAGRKEGHDEALRDALLTQSQLEAAATQALADAMAANRAALERMATGAAESAARLVLAALAAALPRTMQDHAAAEIAAVAEALLPGLRAEPDLRVRAHPAQAGALRNILARGLAGEDTVIAVTEDETLLPADMVIAWAEGDARRDTAQIYQAIRAALAPLNLPPFEDLGRGQ